MKSYAAMFVTILALGLSLAWVAGAESAPPLPVHQGHPITGIAPSAAAKQRKALKRFHLRLAMPVTHPTRAQVFGR